jgi:glycosyltransferase involved in cell wall biosynthesis
MAYRIRMLSTSDHVNNARFIGKIARSLAEAGHRITAWVQGTTRPKDLHKSIRLVLMGDLGKLERFLQWPRALRWALEDGYDLLVVDSPDAVLIGIIVKIFKRKKVLWDVVEVYEFKIRDAEWLHPLVALCASKIFRGLEWIAIRIFDLTVDSEEAYQSRSTAAKRRIVQHNYPWHPGPIDESRGEYARERWAKRGPRLIYVGVVTSKHGLDDLLSAVKLLETDFPDLSLDIVGDITNQDLEDRLLDQQKQLVKPGRVVFHGLVPFSEVRQYYRDAQIATFPLWKMENFACSETTKLFEYCLYGLPMVVGNVPIWCRLMNAADSGEVVEPRDPESIAEAIRLLWGRGRTELEAAGRRAHDEVFRREAFWENDVTLTLKAIDEIMADG